LWRFEDVRRACSREPVIRPQKSREHPRIDENAVEDLAIMGYHAIEHNVVDRFPGIPDRNKNRGGRLP